jgi:hypothetical protein
MAQTVQHGRRVEQLVLIAFIVLLAPIWLPCLVVIGTVLIVERALLHLAVVIYWIPRGKDVLYVNSDSQIWHEYMDSTVLPTLSGRAVTLNWSERAHWKKYKLSVMVFRALGKGREFNPMVIVFRPFRPARVFRYYKPFRRWKGGDPKAVEEMTRNLRVLLES